jgi:hypothetical protein
MVFFTTMFTTVDVNIHALIAKYGIDIQIVRPEMTKFKMFREFSKHGTRNGAAAEIFCARLQSF